MLDLFMFGGRYVGNTITTVRLDYELCDWLVFFKIVTKIFAKKMLLEIFLRISNLRIFQYF